MVRSVEFDIALSFAGEDRWYVGQVASLLRDSGITVFYDLFEEDKIWGKNLYDYLSDIYQNKAQYTIMFISEHYARNLWTNHERQAMQTRAFQEHREYVLPVRFDDTEIPGVLGTTGYVGINNRSPEEFVKIVKKKLANNEKTVSLNARAGTSLIAHEAREPTEWGREDHRRFFPVRMVPIEPGKDEVRKRLSPRCSGPNLQIGIRPMKSSRIDLDELIGKILSGERDLPTFWPHIRGDTYRNEFGLMSCQIWTPPPPDMSLKARLQRWLRTLEDDETRFEYFSHLYERAELWLFDGTTVPTGKEFIGKFFDDDMPRTIVGDLEKRFVKTLDAARLSLRSLGFGEPFDVYVAVVGIGTSRLEILTDDGLPSGVFSHVNKEVTLERNLSVISASETSLDALRPFFMDIWKAYLTARPRYYDRLLT